ncbi:uncharacterized protein LOC116287173 [Actinia tenebrosa]|uniref:Uncharacterized protein LOC116287173 n=1 Tax=Actinia tenebrosa TaxID=6105 RepID=A0A6P8H203_ACTTE|nr:uncharacterized protein LOC116287173 [Actinia tenebrosa]
MANLSYAFRENALNMYRNDVRGLLDSKSSGRLQRTAEKSQPHSSQSTSSHGNLHHASHTPLKSPHSLGGTSGTNNLRDHQQGSTKHKQFVDPYLAALTKETRGKTKQRYSSTDYLMQW